MMLACYFCSPEQARWLQPKSGVVTVCAEHCERVFSICGDTPVDGHAVSTLYRSGKHFCEAHGYRVADRLAGSGGKTCFNSSTRSRHLGWGGIALAGMLAVVKALL